MRINNQEWTARIYQKRSKSIPFARFPSSRIWRGSSNFPPASAAMRPPSLLNMGEKTEIPTALHRIPPCHHADRQTETGVHHGAARSNEEERGARLKKMICGTKGGAGGDIVLLQRLPLSFPPRARARPRPSRSEYKSLCLFSAGM